MKVFNHGLAPLYTLRKDHKETADPIAGPPTRPVCGASSAYNSKLSHFLGMFLRPVWQEQETTCTSTEEMLAAIRDMNDSDTLDGDITVGSADVKALYPSIDIDFAAEICGKMFIESEVEVVGIDAQELGLYLAMHLTVAELQDRHLAPYCPTRVTFVGRPPTITGGITKNDWKERWKSWNKAARTPDIDMVKNMLGAAITIAVKFVMKNHFYTFGGVIRRQARGGPIGLSLTGDVAQVMMAWWDQRVIEKLKNAGINPVLYLRYVDDINSALKNMIMDANRDVSIPKDHWNMLVFQREANSIHPSIQVTIDFPTNYPDLKIPSLDLKLWLSQIFDQVTHTTSVTLMHEHYSKDVSSKAVINARSAIPWRNKRTILTQEVLRILRNCSDQLPWSTTCDHVSVFTARMQYSGYSEQFRAEVVRSALHAYDEMKDKDRKGEVPFYRGRDWRRVERAEERRAKKGGWFKKRGDGSSNETVIFLPATPGSELRKRYMSVIQKSGVRVAVAEVPGTTLKQSLQKSNLDKKRCGDEGCMVCSEGGDGKRCRVEGVTYEIRCSDCEYVYVGETGRNAYTRGTEHRDQLTKKNKNSVLHSHTIDKHADNPDPPTYSMKVTDVYGGDATKRQVAEALKIERTPAPMNRREEFTRCHLPRAVITDTARQLAPTQ